jgi:uncharacterized membrane protein
MIDGYPRTLTVVAAVASGLVAGVFFAFSTFVMSGLGRLPPPQGLAAMNSINVTAVTPAFMTALFATAAACLFLAVSSVLKWQQPGAPYLLVGSLLYLLGVVLVTIVFNVPLNDALAAVKPDTPEGARLWASYLTTWTAWNHIRTVAGLAASAFLTIALCHRAAQ